MRLIHTADVHLGATPDANMPWSQERSLAIRSSFLRIISMAEKNQADLLSDRRGSLPPPALAPGVERTELSLFYPLPYQGTLSLPGITRSYL